MSSISSISEKILATIPERTGDKLRFLYDTFLLHVNVVPVRAVLDLVVDYVVVVVRRQSSVMRNEYWVKVIIIYQFQIVEKIKTRISKFGWKLNTSRNARKGLQIEIIVVHGLINALKLSTI